MKDKAWDELTYATQSLLLLIDSTRERHESMMKDCADIHATARASESLTRGQSALVTLADKIKDEVETAIDDLPELVAVCARAGFEEINFDDVARHFLQKFLRTKREGKSPRAEKGDASE